MAAADAGTRTEVVSASKLISLLQERAQAAVEAGSSVRVLAVRCGPSEDSVLSQSFISHS